MATLTVGTMRPTRHLSVANVDSVSSRTRPGPVLEPRLADLDA
jgi:hypothetical protein